MIRMKRARELAVRQASQLACAGLQLSIEGRAPGCGFPAAATAHAIAADSVGHPSARSLLKVLCDHHTDILSSAI
jgi:hypothetical protein